jgi:hypothetical protein
MGMLAGWTSWLRYTPQYLLDKKLLLPVQMPFEPVTVVRLTSFEIKKNQTFSNLRLNLLFGLSLQIWCRPRSRTRDWPC